MSITQPICQPICRPIVSKLTDYVGVVSPSALYVRMSDTSKPLAAFIEGWALNSFNGVANAAPTGTGIPTDSQGLMQLEYTVSGSAGGTTLTISAGDQSKGTGTWGGVIQHDNGTYGLYTIHSLGSGVATCYPPFRATVTSKNLRNIAGSVNGQHYTLPGYKALARSIYARTKGDAYRMRYAAKWTAATGVKEDWTAVGGLGAGQYSMQTVNAFITGGTLQNTWRQRGRTIMAATSTAPHTGKGVSKTFSLGGASGFMEAFVSCAFLATVFVPFRAVLVVDGVTVFDQTYDANAGLVRVVANYSNATSATLTVTRSDETSGIAWLAIGDVTFWAYDRSETWSDPVIGKDDKVVVIGDSWTEYYSDALGAELAQAQIDAGGTTGSVVSVGLSGQTAEWGLANFDSLVAPENPDAVVILFFTNDRNSFGVNNSDRWLRAMYQMGLKCQAIGARPIFIMPLPTASISQAAEHGTWAERIGAGLPV